GSRSCLLLHRLLTSCYGSLETAPECAHLVTNTTEGGNPRKCERRPQSLTLYCSRLRRRQAGELDVVSRSLARNLVLLDVGREERVLTSSRVDDAVPDRTVSVVPPASADLVQLDARLLKHVRSRIRHLAAWAEGQRTITQDHLEAIRLLPTRVRTSRIHDLAIALERLPERANTRVGSDQYVRFSTTALMRE